ncbi:hypothetical protein [Citrobacter koseri]|uniref:hypothetical protein n=1 Tax=Citrobacter koseri TaxID=545 RepID=UPI00389148D5
MVNNGFDPKDIEDFCDRQKRKRVSAQTARIDFVARDKEKVAWTPDIPAAEMNSLPGDISSTMERFRQHKHRQFDESKLKQKTMEPGAFSSATKTLGKTVTSCLASAILSEINREEKSRTEEYRYGPEGYGYYSNGKRLY